MITLYRYRLPLHSPFRTGTGTVTIREGVIVRYRDNRLDLLAEAAPLPGFSAESLDEVIETFRNEKPVLEQLLGNITDPGRLTGAFASGRYPPSVQFAVSSLAMDLAGDRDPDLLRRLEWRGTIPDRQNASLAVNGVIGLLAEQEMLDAAARLYREGYRTLKFKCGSRPGRLPEVLGRISEQFPDLTLRIDVNRSWPQNRAADFLKLFGHLPLEYCEEPCRFETPGGVSRLRERSPVPLALDESIGSVRRLGTILRNRLADAVILKPTLLGNIPEIIETCFPEKTHTMKRICTTSLESGIGRNSVARLAAVAGTAGAAHGLDTGRLFREDLCGDPVSGGNWLQRENGGWCVPFESCNSEKLERIEPS